LAGLGRYGGHYRLQIARTTVAHAQPTDCIDAVGEIASIRWVRMPSQIHGMNWTVARLEFAFSLPGYMDEVTVSAEHPLEALRPAIAPQL
jgi:hypothetical protein